MRTGLLVAVIGAIVGLAIAVLFSLFIAGEVATVSSASKCKDAHSQIAFAVAKKGC